MYICTKAVRLAGASYLPGDSIPDDAIFPSRVAKLISCGIISRADNAKQKPEKAAGQKPAAKHEGQAENEAEASAEKASDTKKTKKQKESEV